MRHLANPMRGRSTDDALAEGIAVEPSRPLRLLAHCPAHAPTPLTEAPELAAEAGIGALHLKDERERMGLGSFKALGGAYAVALVVQRRAEEALGAPVAEAELTSERVRAACEGLVVCCASAGNHGLSVAAGARVFGIAARIYLAETVPEAFAERLRGLGAEVVRAGAIYEEAMAAATRDPGVLISDSTWPGYLTPALEVLEGYCVMAAEAVEAMPEPPTHIFLQAGVGGLAAALTATFRARWGDGPAIVVVEPTEAPCLMEGVRAGAPVTVEGGVSSMGRLDCKDPSIAALALLSREADHFVALTEAEAADGIARMAEVGWATTPSGGAGVVAALHPQVREAVGMGSGSRVLCVVSEQA